jgi:magnesium transporter
MVYKYKYKNTTWVDLESPSHAEIIDIIQEYGLPEIMAEELGTCTLRSKVDYYEKLKLIYLVLHFPIIGETLEDDIEQEIDFIIGKDILITTRYEKIDPLHNFSRLFEKDTFLDKSNMGDHAGYLFVYLMREIYKTSLDNLEDINDSLKKIERDIFRDRQTEAVGLISETNRKFLNFKQALRHHGEIFKSFETVAVEMFGQSFYYLIGIVNSEYNRVKNTLDVGKEILNDLRDTNDSLLTTKTNTAMRRLTTMTFILLPITLITGIFGMNVASEIIFIKNMNDFLLVLLFIVFFGLTMFIYFKGKKWL